jgi:hypothetical protein
MGRSRRPQCSQGHGCGICGNRHEWRQVRNASHGGLDLYDGIIEFDDRHYEANLRDYCKGCSYCDPSIETFDEWLREQDVYPSPPLTVSFAEVCHVS